MGKAKIIEYSKTGRFKGSLTDADCEMLEQIIEADSNNGCFNDLRHIIYELTDTDTTNLIEDMEYYGQSLHDVNKVVGTLRDEQTLGTAFMYCARNCIIGDSVGMGKTAQIAGLCRVLANIANEQGKDFKYLLLTEKNLIDQTQFKMVKFTGDYAHTLTGDAPACEKFTYRYPCGEGFEHSIVGGHTLFNQSIFTDWLMQCKKYGKGFPFQLLVVDESSILGNSTAGITKNARALFPFFERVVFLNATPFEAKLETFYNQLESVDAKLLPTKTNFQKEYMIFNYSGMYPKPTGKYKNAEQFRSLVGYRYFARTRREKGAVMEDCTGRVLVSPLSPLQKEWLKKTQMPQMVYDCPNYFDRSIVFNEENVPKLESLQKALEEDCEDANTILLFARYRECQDSLSEWLFNEGYSNKILCGDTKDEERKDIIRGFKNGEFKVLVTNVQKGLDFGDCNHCIFFSFDPNPSKMVQFEGRITRSFDIIDKHVVLLCSQGRELNRLNQVIKQRAEASSQFTKTDLSCIMSILLDD